MKKKPTFTFPEFAVGILSEDKRKLEYVYPLNEDSYAMACAKAPLIAKKQLDERVLFDINYFGMCNNHYDELELKAAYFFYETLRIDKDGGREISVNVQGRLVVLTAFDFSNNAKGKKLSPSPRFCTPAELEMELAYTMG